MAEVVGGKHQEQGNCDVDRGADPRAGEGDVGRSVRHC